MSVQVRNDELVSILTPDFQARAESTFAWESAVSNTLNLPGLRGCWTMACFDSSGNAIDGTGLGKTLTRNNDPEYGYDNLVPYVYLSQAVTFDWLERADEADLDILGNEAYVQSAYQGLTMGGWFKFNRSGQIEVLMAKGGGGAATLAYWLDRQAAQTIRFYVSTGAGLIQANSTGTVGTGTWTHIACKFDPSTLTAIYINGVQDGTQAVGVPATLVNSASSFHIGTYSSGTGNLLQGWVSLAWLCAEMHSDAQIWAHYQRTRRAYGV